MAADVNDTVKQAERLVRMISLKYERQKNALADTELQLAGARKMLADVQKVK